MLAVVLGADGWHVEYLGADLPAAQTLALACAVDADVICISTARPESAERLRWELAESVPAEGIPIVVGGRGADADYADRLDALYADGGLASSAAALRRLAP